MENKRNQGYGVENSPNQRLKSTRELALEWWSNLPKKDKDYLFAENKFTRNISSLTSSEIQEMYQYEVLDKIDYQISDTEFVLKPNQKQPFEQACEDGVFEPYVKANKKQFKEFNPELFKAYIDKFSNNDKVQAAGILLGAMPSKDIKIIIKSLLAITNDTDLLLNN